MPVRPGSSSRIWLVWSACNSSRVVHRCPPQPRYWRSSSQMAQRSGGTWVSICWVPQVVQMKWGIIGDRPWLRSLLGSGSFQDHQGSPAALPGGERLGPFLAGIGLADGQLLAVELVDARCPPPLEWPGLGDHVDGLRLLCR